MLLLYKEYILNQKVPQGVLLWGCTTSCQTFINKIHSSLRYNQSKVMSYGFLILGTNLKHKKRLVH